MSTEDDDMTAQEFDRRMQGGVPVQIKRGSRPVSVVVNVVKSFTSSFEVRLARDETSSVAPKNNTVIFPSRITSGPQKTAV